MGFYVVSGNNEFVVEKIISDRNGEFEFVKSFKYKESGVGRDNAKKMAVDYANKLNKK